MASAATGSLHEQPWWTAADQAELELLAHEFVRVAWIHKERCADCSGGPWCARLADAFAAVEEWRAGRMLRSKAEWLRLEQRLREFAA